MGKEQQYFQDLHEFCSQSIDVIELLMNRLVDNWNDIAHVKRFMMVDGRNDFVTGQFSDLELSTSGFFKITPEVLPLRLIVDHSCFIEVDDHSDRTESRKICYIPRLYKYTLIQASKANGQLRLTAVSLQELTEITSNVRIYGHNGASMSKRLQQL